MRRHLASLVVIALFAAGCQAQAVGELKVSPSGAGTQAAKMRAVAVKVLAPGVLANGGAQILTDAGAGLIKGGQILTDAGAGLVARAHHGAPRFAVRAAIDEFKPVSAAGVQAVGLDGAAIGAVAATDEDGAATLPGLPDGRAISIIAAYRVDGKVYRQAATLGADALDGPLVIDPINTMVEARVRDLLKGKPAPTLSNVRLKRVWAICNQADITIAPAELEAGRPLADITAALERAWKAAIAAKVTSPTEKQEIASFIADLEAAGKE